MSNVKSEILEILADYVDTPVEEIDTAAGFKFSTGLDSFVLFSFIGAIEEHFGITIPNETLRSMSTLDDIIAHIESELGL